MQKRQTSILAFLKKPSAENRRCDGPSPLSDVLPGPHFGSAGAEKPSDERFPEIRGTDTPPEKPCCQIFPAGAPEIKGDDSRSASPFSSVMRKFVKENKSEGFRKGYEFDLFVNLGFSIILIVNSLVVVLAQVVWCFICTLWHRLAQSGFMFFHIVLNQKNLLFFCQAVAK